MALPRKSSQNIAGDEPIDLGSIREVVRTDAHRVQQYRARESFNVTLALFSDHDGGSRHLRVGVPRKQARDGSEGVPLGCFRLVMSVAAIGISMCLVCVFQSRAV